MEDELKEIEARCLAASEGNWRAEKYEKDHGYRQVLTEDDQVVAFMAVPANAEFIVYAKPYLLWLVGRVRELGKKLHEEIINHAEHTISMQHLESEIRKERDEARARVRELEANAEAREFEAWIAARDTTEIQVHDGGSTSFDWVPTWEHIDEWRASKAQVPKC